MSEADDAADDADDDGVKIIEAEVDAELPAQRAIVDGALTELREVDRTTESRVVALIADRLGPALVAYRDTILVADFVASEFASRVVGAFEAAGDLDPRNDLAIAGRLTQQLGLVVAREIETLIREGHRIGAMARWRTIYEAWVVLRFINAHATLADRHWTMFEEIEDDDEPANGIATRFLVHGDAERLQHLRELDETGKSVSEGHRAEVESTLRDHVELWGKGYEAPYGWAAPWLKGKRRPSFAAIQASLAPSTDDHREFYRRASWSIHIGAHGLFGYPSHDPGGEGPTRGIQGLPEIGSLAARALVALTREMVGTAPDVKDFAKVVALDEHASKCSALFLEAHRRIEAEFSPAPEQRPRRRSSRSRKKRRRR